MKFIETRGNDNIKPKEVTFSYAILNPSASFGGLYVPKSLPKIDREMIREFSKLSYKELALKILKLFEIDIEEEILKRAIDRYDNFDTKEITPLVKIEDNLFISELYHGPTRAFKDMALQPFGYILSALAKEKRKNYLILAATSGDTGPATLDTFSNQQGVKVVCLYPEGGTSDVQKLQMVTQEGKNLKVIGIKGNFDDAQTALKSLLNDNEFKQELEKRDINLSAANSVNFGRIIFQIIYHIKSYLDLVEREEISLGEEIYSIIPSGNFGNALGAYYAKKMGIPIQKIIIASNENSILTELIKTGIYDIRDKELILTASPAMDILKSSNVERVLYDLFGAERVKELMESLDRERYYRLREEELKELQNIFLATFSTDDEVLREIKNFIDKYNYIIDPHTATAVKAYKMVKDEERRVVISSTAEWTKFASTMFKALKNKSPNNDLDALKNFAKELNIEIPPMINTLFSKEIKHKTIVEKEKIKEEILNFL